MGHALVETLEREYRPQLEELAASLRMVFPRLNFHIGTSPVGTLTPFHGHHLFIECTFPDGPADGSDNVALMIGVCHLDRSPRVMADVCWGHPSGAEEDSLDPTWRSSDEWPEATKSTLDRLREAFPRLCASFRAAVSRGEPTASQDAVTAHRGFPGR
jgi:hypothetical protein